MSHSRGTAGSAAPDLDEERTEGRAYDRRLVGRLWGFARPYRRPLARAVALLPLLATVELVQPYLLKVAIDDYILAADPAGLGAVLGLFVVALLAQYALRAVSSYLLVSTGHRVVRDLRNALFAHVQRLPMAFFDRTPVGRLMTRLLGDAEAVGELFASGAVALLGDTLALVGAVAAMLALDWSLTLVTLASVPLLAAVSVYFRARARAAYREVRNRIGRVNAYLQETILGVAVVQLFGREASHAAAFATLNEAYRCALFRRMRYDALFYAGVEAVGSIAVAALLFWGGAAILREALTFGTLVAFLEYTHRFFLPLRDLSAKYAVMQSALVAAERIFTLLDLPPEEGGPPKGFMGPVRGAAAVPTAGRDGQPGAPAIELEDVWFRYDGRAAAGRGPADDWVLRGASLRVAAGERVALIGPTGAGKSTVARLLVRFYDVPRGTVRVAGVDVRDWDLAALRRHVGLVPQDVVLFAGTLADNITLGRLHADAAALEGALEAAGLGVLLRRLPGGLAAQIHERGANLSHGERQLVAVARALIYNPAVLILDEATSGVDPETERHLQAALERLVAGRTALVIAHRLSTVARADRVLVVRDGRVAEAGPPGALLADPARLAGLGPGHAGPGRTP